MPNDTGHCYTTVAPWRAKCKIKFIVFHILITSDVPLLHNESFFRLTRIIQDLTHYTNVTSSHVIGYRFGNCWLFSDAKNFMGHAFLNRLWLEASHSGNSIANGFCHFISDTGTQVPTPRPRAVDLFTLLE